MTVALRMETRVFYPSFLQPAADKLGNQVGLEKHHPVGRRSS